MLQIAGCFFDSPVNEENSDSFGIIPLFHPEYKTGKLFTNCFFCLCIIAMLRMIFSEWYCQAESPGSQARAEIPQ
jgi:hypothetical protein